MERHVNLHSTEDDAHESKVPVYLSLVPAEFVDSALNPLERFDVA